MRRHKTFRALEFDDLAGKALEADIREELRAHLALATDAGIERGLSPQEAERQALERFGNFEQTITACTRAKRGALTMRHLHLILTVSLLLCCGAMLVMVFTGRARAAEREASLVELHSVLLAEREQTQQLAAGTNPELIRVHIGDVLELVGTYNPGEWTGRYEVERDGTVLLPVLGHVQVHGLSRADVETRLRELYTPYYAQLDLHVRVHQDARPAVSASGEAGIDSNQ